MAIKGNVLTKLPIIAVAIVLGTSVAVRSDETAGANPFLPALVGARVRGMAWAEIHQEPGESNVILLCVVTADADSPQKPDTERMSFFKKEGSTLQRVGEFVREHEQLLGMFAAYDQVISFWEGPTRTNVYVWTYRNGALVRILEAESKFLPEVVDIGNELLVLVSPDVFQHEGDSPTLIYRWTGPTYAVVAQVPRKQRFQRVSLLAGYSKPANARAAHAREAKNRSPKMARSRTGQANARAQAGPDRGLQPAPKEGAAEP